MTKFTPGPWKIRNKREILSSDGEISICDVWQFNDNHKSDTNLIAAAPELYDALEILTDTISLITGENTVEKYRKLLAKARGEV